MKNVHPKIRENLIEPAQPYAPTEETEDEHDFSQQHIRFEIQPLPKYKVKESVNTLDMKHKNENPDEVALPADSNKILPVSVDNMHKISEFIKSLPRMCPCLTAMATKKCSCPAFEDLTLIYEIYKKEHKDELSQDKFMEMYQELLVPWYNIHAQVPLEIRRN